MTATVSATPASSAAPPSSPPPGAPVNDVLALEAAAARERREHDDAALDVAIALDPADGRRQPIPPYAESVLQLGCSAPIEPRGHGIGEDRRLGCAGFCGERLKAFAHWLRQE